LQTTCPGLEQTIECETMTTTLICDPKVSIELTASTNRSLSCTTKSQSSAANVFLHTVRVVELPKAAESIHDPGFPVVIYALPVWMQVIFQSTCFVPTSKSYSAHQDKSLCR
jgi:hypothetical protein